MLKFFHLPIFLFVVFMISANASDKNSIIKAGEYYYGTGISIDVKEARDLALAELTSQISVFVSSRFESNLIETINGISENVESVIKTHSGAIINNVQTLQQPLSGGKFEVFCYIQRSELLKIYDERKALIAEICDAADEYSVQGNIAHALKHYYFCIILLKSLPDQMVEWQGINYTIQIPRKINALLENISFHYQGDDWEDDSARRVDLGVRIHGQPVAQLDFTFWDGSNQVSVQTRDGQASFYLYGSSVQFESLRINVKYAYYENRNEYSTVEILWPLVTKPVFESEKGIKLKVESPQLRDRFTKKFNGNPVVPTTNALNLHVDAQDAPGERILGQTLQFIDQISNPQSDIYSGDKYLVEKLQRYLKYNTPSVMDQSIEGTVNRTSRGWELRRIRVLHSYPNIHRESTEYLVLDFDSTGTLVDFNMAITDNLYQSFVTAAEYGHDWGNRQDILKFIEKYRMAYLSRDLGTVDLMFSDEALIIVGRIIKRKATSIETLYEKFGDEPDVEYLRFTKREYLNRLSKTFKANQDLFLDFSSFNIIKKNNAPNVYGVEMRQSYNSSIYSDEGHLFLLIDFEDVDPLIYVRAWQPNEWDQDKLVRTANFRVRK